MNGGTSGKIKLLYTKNTTLFASCMYFYQCICSGCCMKIIALQLKAVENETGLENNPLTLTWLSGKPAGIPTEGSFTPGVSNTEDISQNTPNFPGVTSSLATGMSSFGFDSSKVI